MKRFSKRALFVSASALTLAAAGAAWAATAVIASEELAINHAKVSLVQAIGAAERHVGGKASSAEYERAGTGWQFEVEVVKGNKVFDVTVDADKATVIAAKEDLPDGDDD